MWYQRQKGWCNKSQRQQISEVLFTGNQWYKTKRALGKYINIVHLLHYNYTKNLKFNTIYKMGKWILMDIMPLFYLQYHPITSWVIHVINDNLKPHTYKRSFIRRGLVREKVRSITDAAGKGEISRLFHFLSGGNRFAGTKVLWRQKLCRNQFQRVTAPNRTLRGHYSWL